MKAQDTAIKWAGTVNEVQIGATRKEQGTRETVVAVGGARSLPGLNYEGPAGHPPAIAVEIWDVAPDTWPAAIRESYGDVVNDAGAWAKKAAELGADLICLRLAGTHPAGADKGADNAAQTVRAVLESVDIPLIVWGCDVEDKDNVVLPVCSQAAKGENCLFGSIKEKNYRTLVASCLADGHKLIAESPCDINIAKQLNILAHDVGFPLENIVIFPTTAALGCGQEFIYSIMERTRIAGLTGDPLMRQPLLCDVGSQAWRTREASSAEEDVPGWGSAQTRGPLWEAITATNYLLAGANLIIMRHPAAIQIAQASIQGLQASGAHKPATVS